MLLAPLLFFFAALQPYDIVVRNGHIIDGTGSPWYAGDIGIRAGKIAAIGHLEGAPARRSIDAHGMVVAPGFIDMLGQSELTILVDPRLPSKIFQGITTEITGEGGSIAPLNDAIVKADHVTYEHYGIKPTWRTLGEYFARLRKQGMGINLATYAGATQIRRAVLGDDDRAPNAAELERMKALVREEMRDGAMGVSTALQYAPAPYAKTEELIALATEAAKAGGIYASHIRDEGNGIDVALTSSRFAEMGMPSLQEFVTMLNNCRAEPRQFTFALNPRDRASSTGSKPVLGRSVPTFDTDVRRLGVFQAVEKERQCARTQNRRHVGLVRLLRSLSCYAFTRTIVPRRVAQRV